MELLRSKFNARMSTGTRTSVRVPVFRLDFFIGRGRALPRGLFRVPQFEFYPYFKSAFGATPSQPLRNVGATANLGNVLTSHDLARASRKAKNRRFAK